MANLPTTVPRIRYTAQDFPTIKTAVTEHLSSVFPDTWRNFTESGIPSAIIDVWCYIADILSYKADFIANEVYVHTCQDRESVVLLARMLGYVLRAASPASVAVTCSITSTQSAAVIISANSLVTVQRMYFEFLSEVTIPAGSTSASATLTQGRTVTAAFTGDGTALQRYELPSNPVIQDSIAVEVDGVAWTQVASLAYADSTTTMQAFVVLRDADDAVTLLFGDGISGDVVPNGSAIDVTYRIGGGVAGNVDVGIVNTSIAGYLEGSVPQTDVTVSLYNYERGSGGLDAETVDWARYWVPRWVSTNNRAVTLYDYDYLAGRFTDATYGAMAFAKARLRQSIPELNTIDVYTWTRDADGNLTAPSTALKDALLEYLRYDTISDAIRLITQEVSVLDGVIVYVDILATVTPTEARAWSTVSDAVDTSLANYFRSAEVTPSEDVHISHIYDTIQDTDGVDFVRIDALRGGIRAYRYEVGDGSQTTFSFLLDDPYAYALPEPKIVPYSIQITAGSLTITDDGVGNLIGDVGVGTNTVNYTTGEMVCSFISAPASGVTVTVEYRYIATMSWAETQEYADGATTLFEGVIVNVPIVPTTLSITAGGQTAQDNGSGDLQIGGASVGSIDYSNGKYDITFPTAPAADVAIVTTYIQCLYLRADVDMPIGDTQIGQLGNVILTRGLV